MWALAVRREPPPPLLDGTPWALLATLAGAWALAAGLVAAGGLPRPALDAVTVACTHGALLAVALAWAGERGASLAVPALLLAVAATAAGLDGAGALTYLALPIWLGVLARRGRLARLGLGGSPPPHAVAAGLAIGTGLGLHLLATASLTLGYHVATPGAATLRGLAYDVGANVLSAECAFRGALFGRLQRRTSFAVAAAIATAATFARYLADPLLPKAAETVLGALFYLTLLGVANCWLLWWSGSLVPGLVGAVGFFAAYRLLVLP